MQLFIRDHLGFILLQLVQFTTIFFMLTLAGVKQREVILYALFLCFVFLLIYLAFYYGRRQHFYERLAKPFTQLDESMQQYGDVPIANQLSELIQSQYRNYEAKLHELYKVQEEHLIFIDRWIHQMKTPLSVLELMARDLDEPEASSFREEIDRLKTGLNMVLYMARLRTIERDFHVEKVTVKEVVQEVTNDNKRLFIQHTIYPKVFIDENLVVETDQKWLYFIVTQLVHNAVKYSAEKAKSIEIHLTERDGRKTLAVTDFGIGIPKEDMKRIFNAFYTGVHGRKFRESTGVGLYVANEVANYLGHSLEVISTVGEGTTFYLVF